MPGPHGSGVRRCSAGRRVLPGSTNGPSTASPSTIRTSRCGTPSRTSGSSSSRRGSPAPTTTCDRSAGGCALLRGPRWVVGGQRQARAAAQLRQVCGHPGRHRVTERGHGDLRPGAAARRRTPSAPGPRGTTPTGCGAARRPGRAWSCGGPRVGPAAPRAAPGRRSPRAGSATRRASTGGRHGLPRTPLSRVPVAAARGRHVEADHAAGTEPDLDARA